VVIGKSGRNINATEADDYIGGLLLERCESQYKNMH
jgi:2-keto-4-pentenoate hydratase/2-oxohepta-3-ene-1,7-dioic acid hydratase in catechol pathway